MGASKLKMGVRGGPAAAGPKRKRAEQETTQKYRSNGRIPAAADDDDDDDDADDSHDDDDEDDDDLDGNGGDDDGDDDDSDSAIPSGPSTGSASRKTTKRRRRAVSPTAFGETMEKLLGDTPSSGPAILSLAPRVRKSANASTLRAKAARIALLERRVRQERAHVRDVIGEWGPPGVLPGRTPDEATQQAFLEQGGTKGYERRLRKVAQRGVVKLFNAIRAAQSTSTEDIDKARAIAGGRHGAKKVNAVGSRETALNELSKNNFLDLLRGSK
ncbi:hypothetical protein MCUN1_001076 [Malassezia cuniculi]|uniref:Rrp15p-domain-containing protein n=1 Tax=Malassezia cuniculi TaxID=948313 RepID=A0AAF0ESF9_9BASI|nr:hypothetical protein MCUN1_001076 [Malassezia cuniculi]